MEHKKATKAQLEKKLKEASVYVSKANRKIHFSDIGVTIYDCSEEIVLESNFHRQIWEKINASGYSETCIMFGQLLEIALSHEKEITKKDKKGNVYYSFDGLLKLDGLSETEHAIIDLVKLFIYTSEGISFSLGFDDTSVLKLRTLFNVSMAVYNKIADAGESEKDLDANDYWNSLISELRLENLYVNIDAKYAKEIKNIVDSAEMDVYNKIKSFIESKGGSMLNITAIRKKDEDEAEALNNLQS